MSDWNNGNGNGWGSNNGGPVADGFEGFESIDAPSQRNSFFPSGVSGIFEIDDLRSITSRKGEPLMIASFKCVRDSSDVAEVGLVYDWVCKLGLDSYKREAKALACAMLPDMKPSEIGAQEMREMCAGEARGIKIFIRSEHKLTRSGSDFTKLIFSAYHGATVEGTDGSESPA